MYMYRALDPDFLPKTRSEPLVVSGVYCKVYPGYNRGNTQLIHNNVKLKLQCNEMPHDALVISDCAWLWLVPTLAAGWGGYVVFPSWCV